MQQLVDLLQIQLSNYQELLKIAEEKQTQLIDNDINLLEQINKDEQKLLLKITQQENQRVQVMRELSQQLDSQASIMTLKEIADQSPQPYQDHLNQINFEFNNVIAKLDKINQENASLIEQALKYIDFSMDILVKDDREVTYSQKEKEIKNHSRIFDQKV